MATTQVVNRQIADGAINDAKVAAGAGIVTSKLADAANFILRGGTIPFTANQSMGGNLITNLGTPSSGTDAATKSYVDTVYNQVPQLFKFKGSVKASATTTITISNPATAVFDGITLSTNDLLLLQNQSAPAENGIYTFNGSGSALTRVGYMDAWTEVPGAMVVVEQGSTYADKVYLCTSDQGGTLGTTAISWTQINSSGLTTSNFVDKETPSGTLNGSNTTFTLANTPTAGSEHLYLNGVLQESGGSNDYTISGATITMLTAPLAGEKIRVSYRK